MTATQSTSVSADVSSDPNRINNGYSPGSLASSEALLETLTRLAVHVSEIRASEPLDWLNSAASVVRTDIAPEEVVACIDSSQSTQNNGWGGCKIGLSAPNVAKRKRWLAGYVDALIAARVKPDRLWHPESKLINGAFVPTPNQKPQLKGVIDVFAQRLGAVDVQYAGCGIQTEACPGPRAFWIAVWYDRSIPEPVQLRQQVLAHQSRITASAYVAALNSGMERRGLLLERLTPGQRRVAQLMGLGHSKKQIAAQLGRSEHTVHDHIKSIYHGLSVRSRAEFMALWADAHEDTNGVESNR